MSEAPNVQYVGFQAKELAREYNFLVRQASGTREFSLAIPNEAFRSHRISYQDAPDFCSAKLHRELATYANHPPQTQYTISEGELKEYQDSHATKAAGSFHTRTTAKEP